MDYVQPLGAAPLAPYVDRNPVGGVEGSVVPARFFNAVNAELVHLIEDAGLTPDDADRQQVRKAVEALIAAAIASLPSDVPAGMVGFFTGTSAPAGWIKANGALLTRADYPELWDFAQGSGNLVSDATWTGTNGPRGSYSSGNGTTTFRVPDLRAEFVRGWDDGRGVDTSRTIGSAQADDFKSHFHSIPHGAVNQAGGFSAFVSGNQYNVTNDTAATGGAETRPRNVALLGCIKI